MNSLTTTDIQGTDSSTVAASTVATAAHAASTVTVATVAPNKGISPKYRSLLSNETSSANMTEKNKINDILEKEKQTNKGDSWTKLDKSTKIQKLHQYADKYGEKHKLSAGELVSLKEYLLNCINQTKLQKSKEVLFDKETKEILDIPSLFLHPANRHFTLRSTDVKRISTLKSITPVGKPRFPPNPHPLGELP